MYPDPGPIHTASGNYQPSAKTQSIATNRAVTFEDEWLQEGGKERERIRPDMKEESMHGCCFIFLRGAADWKQGRISGGWLGDGGGVAVSGPWVSYCEESKRFTAKEVRNYLENLIK